MRLESLEERVLLSVTTTDYDRLINSALEADALETPALCTAESLLAETKSAATNVTGALEAELIAAGQNPEAMTEDFVFNLNSCPDSTYTIYLDFTGHTNNTSWHNGAFTPAYDTDGDRESFSNGELLEIYEIWLRVSEDYIPFSVNVTTSEPTIDALIKSSSGDTTYGTRCCIGGKTSDWFNPGDDTANGTAYWPNGFTLNSDTPCYVFSESHDSVWANAECASHEIADMVGIDEEGHTTYADCNGTYYIGADGWVPITGTAGCQPLTQWSKGEYEGATNTEDDLYIITTKNGFTYRTDDHGNTTTMATALSLGEAGTISSGIIERNTDFDFFEFTLTDPRGTLTIGGIDSVTNLDTLVELYNAEGTLVQTFDPLESLRVVIDLGTLTAGTYYLSVSGTGKTDENGKVIYTDYGSLGAYTIVLSAAPVAAVVTTELDTVDATDGVLSLREALTLVADSGTITFDASLATKPAIKLTGGELIISRSVTLDASALYDSVNDIPGITIDADGNSRVLTMTGALAPTLSLIGLTITGGNTNGDGGGIYAEGTLSLDRCVVTGNNAEGYGGGIGVKTVKAHITVTRSLISLNEASYGGGIGMNIGEASVTVIQSEISGNSARVDGGGLYNYDYLCRSTVVLTNSLIFGNYAASNGGGVYDNGSIISHSTTIAGNYALCGGGIYNCERDGYLFIVNNSIVVKNTATDNSNIYAKEKSATTNYSLIDSADAIFRLIPTISASSTGLNYNAEDWDLSLSSNSPAIDAGSNSYVPYGIETDIAGNTRIYNGTVDIGAYEYHEDLIIAPEAYYSEVNTLNDSFDATDNEWSLREAIYWMTESTTITFAVGLEGTVKLKLGQLVINQALTINGDNRITLNGDEKSRVLIVYAGTEEAPVVLKGLTIKNGKTDSNGGGIYNSYGTLTLTNCVITGNFSSESGGGIYNSHGTITLINSTIAGNSASCDGGICNFYGTLTLKNSIVSMNYAQNIATNINGTLSDSSVNNLTVAMPNFVEAPVFDALGILTNAETMDLHLRSDSAAIDAGDNSAAADIIADRDGNSRIYNDTVDIGAYEYQGDRNDPPFYYSSVVNTLEDSFDATDVKWSLREAIYYMTEYTTITFVEDLIGTITLELGQLVIDRALSIDGDNRITLSGAQANRVIMITAGTEDKQTILNGLTIQNGKADSNGGGIYNSFGVVSLTHCTVSNNIANTSSFYGGGIYNYYGTMTLSDCVISENMAYRGGGVRNDYGTMTLIGCTISENFAIYVGGGIVNYKGGTMTLFDCIISKNSALYSKVVPIICTEKVGGTRWMTNHANGLYWSPGGVIHNVDEAAGDKSGI